KGVHREVESEGSQRQSPDLMDRDCIQGPSKWIRFPNKLKSYTVRFSRGKCSRVDGMNGMTLTRRRSHGRMDLSMEVRSKASHEKSAETIVLRDDLTGEGLNFKFEQMNENHHKK